MLEQRIDNHYQKILVNHVAKKMPSLFSLLTLITIPVKTYAELSPAVLTNFSGTVDETYISIFYSGVTSYYLLAFVILYLTLLMIFAYAPVFSKFISLRKKMIVSGVLLALFGMVVGVFQWLTYTNYACCGPEGTFVPVNNPHPYLVIMFFLIAVLSLIFGLLIIARGGKR